MDFFCFVLKCKETCCLPKLKSLKLCSSITDPSAGGIIQLQAVLTCSTCYFYGGSKRVLKFSQDCKASNENLILYVLFIHKIIYEFC